MTLHKGQEYRLNVWLWSDLSLSLCLFGDCQLAASARTEWGRRSEPQNLTPSFLPLRLSRTHHRRRRLRRSRGETEWKRQRHVRPRLRPFVQPLRPSDRLQTETNLFWLKSRRRHNIQVGAFLPPCKRGVRFDPLGKAIEAVPAAFTLLSLG